MSGNLNLEMRLTANTGQLTTALNSAGSHVRNFTNNVNSASQRMAHGMRSVYQQLNGFSTVSKLAAMAGGYSLLSQTMHRNLEFEKTLLDMKQTAEMTVQQAAEMRKLAIDAAADNMALPSELVAGMKAYSAAGMKFENIKPSIEESARAAVAFRSTVEQMANLDFDLQDKMKLDPKQIKDAHNMLLYHAKSGRYEAAPMAMEAPKVLNSVASVGITGLKGLNFTGAMTQILMKLAPSTQPAEVSTFLEHGMGHITSDRYVKGLKKYGIDVKKFMPNGKFYGEGGVQGILDLAAAMKAKGLDDPFKLDKAGFREMYTKKFWKQLMDYQEQVKQAVREGEKTASDDMVGRDKAEIMGSNYGKAKQFEITKEKAQLSDGATDAVGKVAGLEAWAAENPKTAIAAGLATAIGGRLLWKKLTGGGEGGGLLGKVAGKVGGGMPVMVTNWPDGMGGKMRASERMARLPDALKNGGSTAAGAAAGTLASRAAMLAKAGLAVTAAGAAGYAAGTYLLNPLINKLTQMATGNKDATLGTALYDLFHKDESAWITQSTPNPRAQQAAFQEKQNIGVAWKSQLDQLDQQIAAARVSPRKDDHDKVETLQIQRDALATKLDQLINEMRLMANRPVQVNLDSRPIVEAVNKNNGREARRG